MFPCLLGYALLTLECPVAVANSGREVFSNYFREFLEEEDVRCDTISGCHFYAF